MTYASAKSRLLEFNAGGNKYRLIARVIYEYHRVYVKRVLTHRQYDAGKWKGQR